ncbi:MAG TPA: TIGR01458 family HAD-type hydrolase [Gammaproteobacteria bacterium]|nr:TIGR01458 family HAD-type hydrolase [Gammaproteobacteria bacterium]
MISGILLDLSGVLYVGDQPLEGTIDSLIRLKKTGIPIRYVTNTTRKPAAAIIRQLVNMGFSVNQEELFTAPMAAHSYLQSHRLSPYMLIHKNLREEFTDLACKPHNAVLIGDAEDDFTYRNMNSAFRLLIDGAPLIAMGKNRYFRESDGLSIDAGAFVEALEYSTGAKAIITGKPDQEFFMAAVDSMKTRPEETLMIGDDVDADVDGALNAGLQGILVQTGKYQQGDEERLINDTAITLTDFNTATEWIISHIADSNR